jgi:hypothetical protein
MVIREDNQDRSSSQRDTLAGLSDLSDNEDIRVSDCEVRVVSLHHAIVDEDHLRVGVHRSSTVRSTGGMRRERAT